MKRFVARIGLLPVILLSGFALTSCSAPEGEPDPVVVEVPDPEISHLEPQVLAAIERERDKLRQALDDAEAWGAYGSVLDAHILSDPAEDCYREAHRLAPEEFRWAYLLAIVAEINGRETDEIVALFEQAERLQPDYPPISLRLGDALWRRQEFDAARLRLERAIELSPGAALAQRRMGQVLQAQGDPQGALPYLRRAVELEPRDLAARTALAGSLRRVGETAEASAIIEKSKGLGPVNSIDDPVHGRQVTTKNVTSTRLFARAVQRIDRRDYAGAIRELQVVITARPEIPSVHYWMGTAYQRSGQAAPAKRYLAHALELEPKMNPARVQLAELLAAEGRVDEALAQLTEAQRYAPNDPALRRRIDALRADR